jgi:tetratricopeptide (TPR) repeat protein
MSILALGNASAQWLEDSLSDACIRQGIQYTYNLEFDKAEAKFQQVVNTRPDHPAGYFFLAMVEWWRILINIEDESQDEKFYGMLRKVMDMCDEQLDKDKNNITALFFKGGSVGFRGRLLATRSSWIKAADDGRIALPIVQRAYKLAPDSYDILLGMGIYHYYADVIPSHFPFLKPLMLFVPKGDKQKGIEELTLTSQNARYANIEAKYCLLQLYYAYEDNSQKALDLASRLHDQFPKNILFYRYLGRCYVKMATWDKVYAVFSDITRWCRNREVGYSIAADREAEYYLGLYYLAMNKLDDGLQHFYRSDELSRKLDRDGPSGFMSMANLKMGMIYDLQYKRDLAVKQYEKVLDMKEFKDSHTQAEKYVEKPYGH